MPRALRGPYLALICLFVSTGWAALPAGAPAIPSLIPRSGVVGAGMEVLSNYFIAANGNTYDYVLLTGTSASVTADAAMGQITRVLFIDLDDDIVTIEFSGAGSLMVTLANATGPALPLKYNPAAKFGQPLNYMKGQAAITVTGANATTNVSVFSVGRATEVDQTIFRDSEVYDGAADISRVTIVADPANSNFTPFGSLRLANAICSASSGVTGIAAANVAFNGPVFIGDIKAYDTAIPALQLGSASDTRIVGGNLLQPNGKPIIASGINNLMFVAGATSHGATLPAQTNQGQLSQAPALTSGSSATFAAGAAGSFTVTAMGFPAPTFSVASGTLPSWATLNATTGVISGTPANATGSPFTFTLQASNGNGSPATQSFTLTVLEPLSVAPLTHQTVTAGGSATWTASVTGGGSLTYQWRRDGQPIAGATAASYTIPAATMFDAASYDVVVTRGASQVIAAAGMLSVAPTQYPGVMRVDPSFAPFIEAAGGAISTMVRQPDGKVVVGGQFTRVSGGLRSNLARVNANGEVDTTFSPGTGPDAKVWALALQPNGKILLVGEFVTYNGVARNGVARINADGSLDETFDPGTGANQLVTGIGLQADGKVVLGGAFTTFNGSPYNNIVRLNADGSPDTAFLPGSGPQGAPLVFAFQPDGRILIAGSFIKYNETTRLGVARLNVDGSLDTTFTPVTDTPVYNTRALALQGDGKILVGAFPGDAALSFLRLNADGSRDITFNPRPGNGVNAIAVQGDGKIVVGGWFSFLNGGVRHHVARFLADGTIDPSFDPGTEVDFEVKALALQPDGGLVAGGSASLTGKSLMRLQANGTRDASVNLTVRSAGVVENAACQPDGKILLAGEFAFINNVGCGSLARLNADGTLDSGFKLGAVADPFIQLFALQRDGRIVVFSPYTGTALGHLSRLNADGTVDATFVSGSGTGGMVNALVLQPDGKIVIGGSLSSYNGAARPHLIRFNADGTPDASFDPGTGVDVSVDSMALQSDGRILLAGVFTHYNGTSRPGMARIAADGSLDTGFVPPPTSYRIVQEMVPTGEGRTVVSLSDSAPRLQRLLPDGSLDVAFSTGSIPGAGPLLLQADGRVLTGGSMGESTLSLTKLARYRTDGTADTTFRVPGLRTEGISRILLLEDGRLLVAGTRFKDAAVEQAGLVRLVPAIAPSITSVNYATFVVGEANSFVVTATGAPAPTISDSWGSLPAWASLDAVTGVISGTPPAVPDSPIVLKLQASNGTDTVATQYFFLTVRNPLAVAPLASQTVTAGSRVTLNASVTGGGALTYQWRRDGQPIVGANEASYTIAAATMFDAASYDVVVTRDATQVVASAAVLSVAPTQYPGTLRVDPTFTPLIEADGGAVYAIARQADGKLVIGGQFARINGVARSNLTRLNADGTVDTSFASGSGPNDTVWKIVVQPDGNILIAGDFVSYNGTTRGHVARVRPNGSLDVGFDPGWGANGQVLGLGLQPDGKVLLGGSFSTVDGRPRVNIARLNASGSVDEMFNSGNAAGTPTSFVVLPDGKILIGGGFERFNGVSRGGVARLNADGSLDTAFVPDTGGAWGVTTLARQADGKILVGADNFTSPAPNFMRLNADGSRDTSFSPPSSYRTYALGVQSDGKIVIGGVFTLLNGALRNHVARYLPDGTLDTSFDPGSAFDFNVRALVLEPDGSVVAGGYFGSNRLARVGATGANDAGFRGTTRLRGTVWDTARQRDGKILLVGDFAYVNGVACRGIARLQADGALDGGFSVGSGPSSTALTTLALQADGQILVGGGFTTFNGVARKYLVRLAKDGAVDATFDAGSGPNGQVNALVLQPDGKILIGGSFTAFNGTSRSRILRLTALGAIDPSFDPGVGPDNSVDRLVLQADGRILLAGSFSSYNGTSRAKLVRIAADGALDTGFVPSLPTGSSISGMLALPDGKTVLAVSGTQSLVRLLSNGSADSNFTTGNLSTTFYSAGPMLLQADGRLLAGRMLNVSGMFSPAPAGIARLGTNGAVDTTFNVLDLRDAAFSRIIMLEDGGLLVAGSRFNDGTVDQIGLARLVNVPATTFANPLGAALGSSHGVFDNQYLGTRFVLESPLRVTSVTVQLTDANGRNLFVAIVRLPSVSSFPTASSTTGLSDLGEVVFSTPFNPGIITGAITPVSIPVSVTLNAGSYAVVVGAGLYGSPGGPSGSGGASGGMQNYALTTGSDTIFWVKPGTAWSGPQYDFIAQGTPTYGITMTGVTVARVAPAIIAPPASRTVTAGTSAAFTSAASGTPAPELQWQRQPAGTIGFVDLSDGGSYSGATTVTLTVSNTTRAMSGDQFRCVASNGSSIDAISAPVTLTVEGPPGAPTITTQPANRAVGVGMITTFTVASGGTGPFTYQWWKDGVVVVDDGRITGATTATLSIDAITLADAGGYSVVVTNALDSATSIAGTLAVLDARGDHLLLGGGYVGGGTVTISNTFTHAGELSALGWQVLLPAGWSYASGSGAAADILPHAGDTDYLEWAWTTIPASPFTFTFTLNVPAGTTGPQAIAALMLPRQSDTQYTVLAKPDPLVIDRLTYHSADVDRDGRFSLNELLRVIELYNTRNGTVRTGAYAIDANNLEDGFTMAPARLNTASVMLAKYHSADSNHDGKLDLNELLRVIELYNHRNGTVRTGQYHVQANTEDGFASGP